MRIYLSHPYGGNPENREASKKIHEFYKESWEYEGLQHTMVNPLELLEECAGKVSEQTITRAAVEIMRGCDAVLFCQNWQESRGCRVEHAVAELSGMKIYYLDRIAEEAMTA